VEFQQKVAEARGIRFSLEHDGQEVARAYLYLLKNDLHTEPFGLLEDVFVEEQFRGQGLGTQLLQEVIEAARRNQCYKIVATSRHTRPNVHKLYESFGFTNWGFEFRLNL